MAQVSQASAGREPALEEQQEQRQEEEQVPAGMHPGWYAGMGTAGFKKSLPAGHDMALEWQFAMRWSSGG